MSQQFATTKLSSKGQIVIPEKIRKRLHLTTGDQFIVSAEEDVVILKRITAPDVEAYRELIERARKRSIGQAGDAMTEANWPEHFFEETFGAQADDPLERPAQGAYPEREALR